MHSDYSLIPPTDTGKDQRYRHPQHTPDLQYQSTSTSIRLSTSLKTATAIKTQSPKVAATDMRIHQVQSLFDVLPSGEKVHAQL